jgi:orotidine-5'-phosphate decarboxylase
MLNTQTAVENATVSGEVPLNERLIVALDVPTVEEAREVVRELGTRVSFYKVGMQLQFAGGLQFTSELIQEGKKVFLDSKLLDIEQTITNAVQNVAKMGVTFLTVHGERKAIEAAVRGRGSSNLKVLAVTFLTNLDERDLRDLHFPGSIEQFVLFRARLAVNAGADGVIASGQETSEIRKMAGNKLTIVVPGIRPAWSTADDQRRPVTPYEAITSGADYLVVGRPILNASSKIKAAGQIFSEIEKGLTKADCS